MEEIDIPKSREIRLFCCTTDGKNKFKELTPTCPDHYFLILTSKKYNKCVNHYLGVPMTSKEKSNYVIKYGLNISPDDIDGDFKLEKDTFILCDRPCRISKDDLSVKVIYNKIYLTEGAYNKIIERINLFLIEEDKNNN